MAIYTVNENKFDRLFIVCYGITTCFLYISLQ
ncbi:hypothetical protein GECvBMG_gp211c [Salmonella phage GEC_vB_MG]|nr:hypothetical protein GECvBMG_gp211c [Salmonella phage GEC_vB_MG]